MFASFISCVIVVSIQFQFWNDRYIKAFESKYLYLCLHMGNVVSVMLANMLMNPIVNLAANVLWVAVIGGFFYYEDNRGRLVRIVESEVLLVIIGVTEAMGVYLIDLLLAVLVITPESPEIKQSIENMFSKIVVLFLYYVIFSKIWKKTVRRTGTQYLLYLIMFIYSVVNVLATAAISSKEHPMVLMLIIGCTIFADMYLLYFIKCLDERNYYKMQVEMMEQQEKMQYENYEIQREKYREAMSILHDVKKHIKMIEGLYQGNLGEEAIHYTKQINDMLRPLAPMHYNDNPILNCLLSDKMRAAEFQGIMLDIEISTADVSFMKPIDITTLFGNLLDNAMAACRKYDGKKQIGFYMQAYKDMLSIRVENSSLEPVAVKNGKITSAQMGIGLMNIHRCIEEYEGSIFYKNEENKVICDILLNMTEKTEK